MTWEPLADGEFVPVASPAGTVRIGAGRVAAEGLVVPHGVPLVSYAEEPPITRRHRRHVFGTRLGGRAAITVPDLRGCRRRSWPEPGSPCSPLSVPGRAGARGHVTLVRERPLRAAPTE